MILALFCPKKKKPLFISDSEKSSGFFMRYVCKKVSAEHYKVFGNGGFGREVSSLLGSMVENIPWLGEQGAAITEQHG